jgi:hypothetical protein
VESADDRSCSVLNDDFSGGINTDVWTREVRLDGYGHGEFEWTTNSDNNSFVKDGTLYLVPTLTSDIIGEDAITNGYTLNLTADGTCTSTNVSQCVAVSNSSRLTVINPVRSARLTTRNSVNIKYGKVEVVAKLPTGDWLWPSIFMLPVNETYGPWPRSGEIDLLEARGNNASYPNRGVDYAQSSLHWGEWLVVRLPAHTSGEELFADTVIGPTTDLDRLYMTWGYREQRRTYYSQQFHTFGLEWNENYMWTCTSAWPLSHSHPHSHHFHIDSLHHHHLQQQCDGVNRRGATVLTSGLRRYRLASLPGHFPPFRLRVILDPRKVPDHDHKLDDGGCDQAHEPVVSEHEQCRAVRPR